MEKTIGVMLVIAWMSLIIWFGIHVSHLAHADRLEDLQKRYTELAQRRNRITNEMIQLEGMYRERQAMIAEGKANLLKEEMPEEQPKQAEKK